MMLTFQFQIETAPLSRQKVGVQSFSTFRRAQNWPDLGPERNENMILLLVFLFFFVVIGFHWSILVDIGWHWLIMVVIVHLLFVPSSSLSQLWEEHRHNLKGFTNKERKIHHLFWGKLQKTFGFVFSKSTISSPHCRLCFDWPRSPTFADLEIIFVKLLLTWTSVSYKKTAS